jgi:molybdopterin-containing oxidoreductase family iron-sulfur binding subunit
MSEDKLHDDVRPENATAPEGTTFSRRSFLQGVGLAAGVVASGVIPAVLTAGPAAAADATATAAPVMVGPGASEEPLAAVLAADQSVNYPGKPVYYADPAGPEKWAMVIDVRACVGCRKCVYACVKENNIGRTSGFTFIQVLQMEPGKIDLETGVLDYEEAGRPDKWYFPIQCMHCAHPPCVYGCPVIATWKEPDGTVLIDYNKCIG